MWKAARKEIVIMDMESRSGIGIDFWAPRDSLRIRSSRGHFVISMVYYRDWAIPQLRIGAAKTISSEEALFTYNHEHYHKGVHPW
jgi:hypothetical protein